jgi:AcrR family transcriptional regulator
VPTNVGELNWVGFRQWIEKAFMPDRLGIKPKRVSRRPQEQRRRQTKDAILKATMTVLIEDGYEKFTTTRVAKTAGVSRGAQENYFRTKNELIVAATRYALTRAAEHARSLAERTPRSSEPIEKFLADSKSFFFSPTYLALMEIVAVARRNSELAKVNTPVVRQFRRILNTIWIDALCEAGYERRSVVSFVKMTHYLLRGMALTMMWQPRRSEYPKMLDEWRRIAIRELKRD